MTRRITPEQCQVYQQQWNQPVEDGDVEGQRKKLNAAYWVAYCLKNGQGGADHVEAHAQQILEQVIQQQTTGTDDGTGKHQSLLAIIIYRGNEERARRLFRQAVPRLEMEVRQGGNDENYQEAAYHLGECLFFGRGVDQDLPCAIHWLKIAAELGHAGAQYHIAHNGFGEPFEAEIVSWLQKIADQNNSPWAQRALGNNHEIGRGVKQDFVKAVQWYNKAISQGDDTATRCKQALLAHLSPPKRSRTLGCVVRNKKIEKASNLIRQSFVDGVTLGLWSHALASFQHQEHPPWEAPSPTFLSLKDAIMPQLQKQSKKQKRKRGLESSQGGQTSTAGTKSG